MGILPYPYFPQLYQMIEGMGIWPILNDPVQVLYLRQEQKGSRAVEKFQILDKQPPPPRAKRRIYSQLLCHGGTCGLLTWPQFTYLPGIISAFYKGPFSHTEHL